MARRHDDPLRARDDGGASPGTRPRCTSDSPAGNLSPELIRQKIKLEANDSPTLFAIRPIRSIDAGETGLRVRRSSTRSTARSSGPTTGSARTTTWLSPNPTPAASRSARSRPTWPTAIICSLSPSRSRPNSRPIALPVVASITQEGRRGDPGPGRGPGGVPARLGAIPLHAPHGADRPRSSTPSRTSSSTAKRGTASISPAPWRCCSARSTSPARMVNGFKGGDWNELTQTMNVRQKHAHSWVEAYVGMGERESVRSGSPSTPHRASSAMSRSLVSAASPGTSGR